jgi:hypothetical protein
MARLTASTVFKLLTFVFVLFCFEICALVSAFVMQEVWMVNNSKCSVSVS